MASGSGSVIVAGAVLVDLVLRVARLPRPGRPAHGDRVVQQGGGRGANQALAARRMGARVTLLGGVGDDEPGRAALAALAAEGVDVGRCLPLEGERTGLAMIIVDDAGEDLIAVAPGAGRRLAPGHVEAMVDGLEPEPGSICLVTLELDEATVRAVVRWAGARCLRLILDPAPARPLHDEILDAHPILTPNESEAARLSGRDDPGEAARWLAGRTGSPVIVSLGSRGALLGTEDAIHALPAFPVTSLDPTGAGDALNGILAAELASGASLEAALRLAVVGAALATTVTGAQDGLPTRERVLAATGS